eukprot:12885712-Prorocentrum_lima.AAC.1
MDNGKTQMPLNVVGDNDGVFKCVINDNPKMSTEPTLIAHVRALRDEGSVREILWCDSRDMIAGPLTQGKNTKARPEECRAQG